MQDINYTEYITFIAKKENTEYEFNKVKKNMLSKYTNQFRGI